MLTEGCSCRLSLGSCISDQTSCMPLAIIDKAHSQSFIMLDGGITGNNPDGMLVYSRPDVWTWKLFRQLVSRLQRSYFNNLYGIISDTLRRFGYFPDQGCQGSATFIVGSTLPNMIGTEKFMVVDLKVLSDGSAMLFRPHGPKGETAISNLDSCSFPRLTTCTDQSMEFEGNLYLEIEKTKANILRNRLKLKNLHKKVKTSSLSPWPVSSLAFNGLPQMRSSLQRLPILITCDEEKLEELQFQIKLAHTSKDLRNEQVLERSDTLHHKMIICIASLILQSILASLFSTKLGISSGLAVWGLYKKLQLLQDFFSSWYLSEEARRYRAWHETLDVTFDALDHILGDVFQARLSISPGSIQTEERYSKQTESYCIATDIMKNISNDALSKNLQQHPARLPESSYIHADILAPVSRHSAGEALAKQQCDLTNSIKQNSATVTAKAIDLPSAKACDSQNDHDDTLHSLRLQLESAYPDMSQQSQMPRSEQSFPQHSLQSESQEDNIGLLFAKLPADIQHCVDVKNGIDRPRSKVVRFNAHAENIGAFGWSVGVSKLITDESRRHVIKSREIYPLAKSSRYEPVAYTSRLISDLTKKNKWYPNIRIYYQELEDSVLGPSQWNRPSSTADSLPWQLLSYQRESCPPEFYRNYQWTVYNRDIIVIGNHSLWNSITNQELTSLINDIHELKSSAIARNIVDRAMRIRIQFPRLFQDSEPMACIACKVELSPELANAKIAQTKNVMGCIIM